MNIEAINSANGCNIIFSVTREILDKYKHINVPKHFIHHGLAKEFINVQKVSFEKDDLIRVGVSGNFLRNDIDRPILLRIIQENSNVIFDFFGSYLSNQSNIGGGSDSNEQIEFINKLQGFKNVIMYGPINPKQLAIEFQRMDAFLICYDIQKDQSKGTNYHKVMEYLSTGKVIMSNNITTYSSMDDLIVMCNNRLNNDELLVIFRYVILNLDNFNSDKLYEKRKEFASSNSYSNKILKIQKILND